MSEGAAGAVVIGLVGTAITAPTALTARPVAGLLPL